MLGRNMVQYILDQNTYRWLNYRVCNLYAVGKFTRCGQQTQRLPIKLDMGQKMCAASTVMALNHIEITIYNRL